MQYYIICVKEKVTLDTQKMPSLFSSSESKKSPLSRLDYHHYEALYAYAKYY